MLGSLEIVLWPIIWVMDAMFGAYLRIVGSIGLSIILVSVTFAVILQPLRKWAGRVEKRIGDRMNAANSEVTLLRGKMKGEELFLATEAIYKTHGYHPVQSIGMGLGLFVMLPVLIAAVVWLTGLPLLDGASFLFISDLSEPDGLLGVINALPVVMLAVTIMDANIRFRDNASARRRFYFVSGLLFLLVYNFSSALVIYWTSSNVVSALFACLSARLATGAEPTKDVGERNRDA